VAASGFRGSYVMASQMARFAGRTRWARVRLGGKVEVAVDLAIPKYWPLVLGRMGHFERRNLSFKYSDARKPIQYNVFPAEREIFGSSR